MTTTALVPNHHADHAGFHGVGGLLIGLTMSVGRGAIDRLAADLTEVRPGDHVADVGCGPGGAAREAARRGAAVTGIDPAPVMLQLARRLTWRRRVTWSEGAAESLPLPDASATVLWSIASVHHWPELDAGLAEAHRVLSPGGRFLAIERRTRPGATGLASHGWTDAQADAFAERCQAAGFVAPTVARHTAGRRHHVLTVQATR
jgi:ubiquinone/menaquinone biosynthesis C-methylase UbiE